jgi:hypothetical protein
MSLNFVLSIVKPRHIKCKTLKGSEKRQTGLGSWSVRHAMYVRSLVFFFIYPRFGGEETGHSKAPTGASHKLFFKAFLFMQRTRKRTA